MNCHYFEENLICYMKKVMEKNGNSSKAKKGTVEEWTRIDGPKTKQKIGKWKESGGGSSFK